MDNSATVYPMVVTKKAQSLFRIGAVLTEPVRKDVLSRAAERAFLRFPFYKVRLRYGFFRPYFESNPLPYPIFERTAFPLQLIDFPKNNNYLLRTSYAQNAVYMDFFHALCDANGAVEFLKTVLYYYLTEVGEEISAEGVRLVGSLDSEEWEDAFEKYYKPFSLAEGIKKMAGGSAVGITRRQFSEVRFAVNRVSAYTDGLLNTARNFGCSITVFVTALLAQAIAESVDRVAPKQKYIFFIPINYRKFFPSRSLYNFTGFARCILPKGCPFETASLCKALSQELKQQMEKSEMELKLRFSSLMTHHFLLKMFPYKLTRAVSLLGRNLGKKPKQTMIVSNLGKIGFPDVDKVQRFVFNINCAKKTPENVGIISYKEKTEICFTRKLVEDNVDKRFFDLLSELCECDFYRG